MSPAVSWWTCMLCMLMRPWTAWKSRSKTCRGSNVGYCPFARSTSRVKTEVLLTLLYLKSRMFSSHVSEYEYAALRLCKSVLGV